MLELPIRCTREVLKTMAPTLRVVITGLLSRTLRWREMMSVKRYEQRPRIDQRPWLRSSSDVA